jgi:hypothetical protein
MRGSCLCGGVSFEAADKLIRFALDHCTRCQKSTGSAFGAWIICEREGFRWVGGESLVRRYVAPVRDTPPGYPRTFCAVCGGPVPYVDENFVGIPAGTIDGDPGVRPQVNLFFELKAPWFDFRDDLASATPS